MRSCCVLGFAAECAAPHCRPRRARTGLPPGCLSVSVPWSPLGTLARKSNCLQTRHFRQSSSLPKPWTTAPPKPPSIHPHSSSSTSAPLPEQLRAVMRLVTNSVVVCTSKPAETAQGHVVPLGLTMSSFTSLSLSPGPIVTFNIAMPSRTEAAIAESRHFMIHILAGDVAGARVADLFRYGNADPEKVYQGLDDAGCEVVNPSTSVQDSGELKSFSTLPFLEGRGILYVLRCRLLDEPSRGLVPVRDHVIVLGEVLEIIKGEGDIDDRFGLIYADRHYRQLDGSMVKVEEGSKTT